MDTVTLTRAQVEELRAIIHNAESPLGNRLQDVSSRLYFALDGAGWIPRPGHAALPIDFKQATDQGGWQPIASAPIGLEMFVARAFDASLRTGGTYTTDPYCVWQERKGQFVWWPHGALPPTHWMPLPAAPTLLGVADGDAVGGKSGGAA